MAARRSRGDTDSALVPPPVPYYLAPRIHALATMLRRSFGLAARRETGLSHEKARILVLLGDLQPILVGELAAHTTLDNGQLSRGLKEMVEGGLIRREQKGRTGVLSLTPRGCEVFERLKTQALARNDELLQDLDEAQRLELYRLIDQIILRADSVLKRERVTQTVERENDEENPSGA